MSPLIAARTGRDGIPDLDFYMAFNLFRLAGIVHGIKGRLVRGTASSAHAAEMAARLEPLAELAWAQARRRPGRAEPLVARRRFASIPADARGDDGGRRAGRRLRRALRQIGPVRLLAHAPLPRPRPLPRPLSPGRCRSPATPSARSTTCASDRAPSGRSSRTTAIVLVTYNDETLRAARQALAARPARCSPGAARDRPRWTRGDRDRHTDRPGPARGCRADRSAAGRCARRPGSPSPPAEPIRDQIAYWQEEFLRGFLAPGRVGPGAAGEHPAGARPRGRRHPALARASRRPAAACSPTRWRRSIPSSAAIPASIDYPRSAGREARSFAKVPIEFTNLPIAVRRPDAATALRRADRGPLRPDRRRHPGPRRLRDADDPRHRPAGRRGWRSTPICSPSSSTGGCRAPIPGWALWLAALAVVARRRR